jgi:hypothetical protein
VLPSPNHQSPLALVNQTSESFSEPPAPRLCCSWTQVVMDKERELQGGGRQIRKTLTGAGAFEGHVILGAEQRSQPAHGHSSDFSQGRPLHSPVETQTGR